MNLLEIEIKWQSLRTRKSVSLKLDPYSAIYLQITHKDEVLNLPITIHNKEFWILKHHTNTFELECLYFFHMQGNIKRKNTIFLLNFAKLLTQTPIGGVISITLMFYCLNLYQSWLCDVRSKSIHLTLLHKRFVPISHW